METLVHFLNRRRMQADVFMDALGSVRGLQYGTQATWIPHLASCCSGFRPGSTAQQPFPAPSASCSFPTVCSGSHKTQ